MAGLGVLALVVWVALSADAGALTTGDSIPSSAPTPTDASAPPAGPSGGTGADTSTNMAAVAAGAVGGLVVGAVVASLVLAGASRRRRRGRPGTTVSPTAPTPATPSESPSALVDTVIAVRDLVEPGSVVYRRLGEGLRSSGIVELAPEGQPFDPTTQHATHAATTREPRQAGRVASVERVGYANAHHLLRPPEVVVYRLEER